MKDKTLAYAMYIAIGFAIVGFAIEILFPLIQGTLDDADDTKPNIPTSYYDQPVNETILSNQEMFRV